MYHLSILVGHSTYVHERVACNTRRIHVNIPPDFRVMSWGGLESLRTFRVNFFCRTPQMRTSLSANTFVRIVRTFKRNKGHMATLDILVLGYRMATELGGGLVEALFLHFYRVFVRFIGFDRAEFRSGGRGLPI